MSILKPPPDRLGIGCSPSSIIALDASCTTKVAFSKSQTLRICLDLNKPKHLGMILTLAIFQKTKSRQAMKQIACTWGYLFYRQMFNSRQLLGLELSCRFIAELNEQRVRNALATNLSDLLRYQNMLCRYDSMALKSLDIFSVHGFPVGLIQCESNFIGIPSGINGDNIGSGGWSNIIMLTCHSEFNYKGACNARKAAL